MQSKGLFLTCLLALCPACFSPSASDDALGGDTEGRGEIDVDTDGSDAPSGTSTSGAAEPASGGDQPGTSTTGADPDGGTGDETTGGEPETTGPTDGGEGSTGEACLELGTNEDCRFCGDACAGDATCHPEGCLAATELGFPEPFGDIGGVDGFLYGFPIEVDADGHLTHFGFIAAGDGAGIQMALYSDLDGAPHALVAESDAIPNYAEGTYQLDVPQTELPAGTYWLMATLGYPRRIAADLNGGQVNFPVSGIIHDFGQSLPDVLEDSNAFVNFRPNFFVGVLQ